MERQDYVWVSYKNNLDHDGKPIKGKSVEYNDDFCEKGKKFEWKK